MTDPKQLAETVRRGFVPVQWPEPAYKEAETALAELVRLAEEGAQLRADFKRQLRLGTDQVRAERDAAEAEAEALPTEPELRRLVEHIDAYDGQRGAPRTGQTWWRQHGQHIDTIARKLQTRRAALDAASGEKE